MIDRKLATSGFDTETLVSEAYLAYLLLAQIEAGFLPLEFPVADSNAGIDATVRLHPPSAMEYQRLYDPHPDAVLPAPVAGSFGVELVPGEKSPVASLTVNTDGTLLLAGSWDGLVVVPV